MVWPFRRRKIGRHRLSSPQVGMVLPGVALACHPSGEPPVAAVERVEADVFDAPGREPELAAPSAVSVPFPRAADEPEIMPPPARVVLFFDDGSQQVMAPFSEESESMSRAASRLLGASTGGRRRTE